ncbi:hypothetical protein EZV73_22220 [Acidaminobacter sp. JC074]|uniref:hypothetical protein n=1 Tax=Acidaminobacter sp. JC074 TaxID=2530199 RepID=UPI001F115E44|nr:hypothetical protein [Acidaminobacter sp. JC074]MCH4890315.1 hypothetical protein [Acidaminobacter sp. JC074]
MLKKILIGILVIALIGAGAAYYTYKKVEKQFETYMLQEVERQLAAAEKAVEDKLPDIQLPEESQGSGSEESETTEVEAPVDESQTDVTIETTIEVVEETPTETAEDTPAETVVETPTETVEEIPTETVEETPAETVEETPAEAEKETPTETIEETPVETVEETPEEPAYTIEDFERDKKVAMDLAMSRLSASQISRLIDLAEGGFSPDEKAEAKEMFYSNFTNEEQEWILDIYVKYYHLVNEGA